MANLTVCTSNRCNNSCLMCPLDRAFFSNEEIGAAGILQQIDALPKGADSIGLSGGEPTLNMGLLDIIKHARKSFPDTEISLLTNGRLFSYKDYLNKFLLFSDKNIKFCIPIHGHADWLHDSITQIKDSFSQAILGISNLLASNFTVELRVVINRINYPYLEDIAKFIASSPVLSKVAYVVFIAMEIEGQALKNKKSITARYSDLVPELEKAVDLLLRNNIKVRLYHFPLCVLEPKFWNCSWKSVDPQEVCLIKECAGCLQKRSCVGILRSYLKHFGGREFKHLGRSFSIKYSKNRSKSIESVSPGNIKNSIGYYSSDRYKEFSSSLSDIIAVKHGIKPLARLSCDQPGIYERMKPVFKDDGIFTDYTAINNDTINVYISKDKALARHIKANDPETKEGKPAKKEIINFAKALGYPDCCIKKYLDSSQRDAIRGFLKHQVPQFYLNNLLHSTSNYWLSFHMPCDYKCKNSLEYNKRIFQAIEKDAPGFSAELKKFTKLPILAWFNNPEPRLFYDDRAMLILNGTCKDNTVFYSKVFYLKTDYPHSRCRIDPELLYLFSIGNRAEITGKMINIFKQDKFIGSRKKKNIFDGCLFNFSG
ncbi:MAG: radical SAM protein [Candidatus Omnitrophica bacterium]|nr:radical SAM protein [Candidatus Omnitrophota bacterium]